MELSTLKMQNEGELFFSTQIYFKLKAYHGTQIELADRIFSLMCTSINSCTHQKRLTVFSLDEYFSKLHLNRNTIYQLLGKFLPKRFSIHFEKPGHKKKQQTHTNL